MIRISTPLRTIWCLSALVVFLGVLTTAPTPVFAGDSEDGGQREFFVGRDGDVSENDDGTAGKGDDGGGMNADPEWWVDVWANPGFESSTASEDASRVDRSALFSLVTWLNMIYQAHVVFGFGR